MTKPIEIDRCVCYDLRFRELQERLAAPVAGQPASMDEIARRFGCGSCCGMCRPYIERMLETGETVFNEILAPASPASPASDERR